jgi:hypothetical protein
MKTSKRMSSCSIMVLTKSGGGFYQTTRISLIYLKFARQNDEKGSQWLDNRVAGNLKPFPKTPFCL